MIRKIPIKVKPYEHQVKAFNFAIKKLKLDCSENAIGSCALLMDMGLGKSLTRIAVVNYEATWRMEQELNIYKPDMVICDESQKIKNHTASQSKTMHRLGLKARYKMILTGTPIQSNALDVFSQWKFLDPRIFGVSFYAFRNRYCTMGGYYNHQVLNFKNMDELTEKAHSISYRVKKEEALDLPDQVFLNRYVTLESSARHIYETVKKQSYTELSSGEITATNVLTKLMRLSQISGGFVTDDDGKIQNISKAKINELKEILDDIIIVNDKKLVIFARFIPEIISIKRLAEEMQINYSIITGAVPPSERGEAIDKFQNSKEIKLFIAQIQTAGLGITLTAADALEQIHRININSVTISGILSGDFDLEIKSYQVFPLFDKMIDIANNNFHKEKDKVKFITNIDDNIPKILDGDSNAVSQILQQVLSNAFKYTKEGTITLNIKSSVKNNKYTLSIKITDTGIGIK